MTEQHIAGTIGILGAGWLGLPLARALLAAGKPVEVTVSSAEKAARLQGEGIHAHPLTISADMPAADKKEPWPIPCETLVICVPPSKTDDYPAAVARACALAKASGTRRVLFVSATSVWGAGQAEGDQPKPRHARGERMLAAELAVQAAGFECVMIVRPSGLYGPDRHPGRFLAGKTLEGGAQAVNLVHLDDVVAACLLLLERGKDGDAYNLSAPVHPRREQFYPFAARQLGLPAPVFIEPAGEFLPIDGLRICEQLGFNYRWPDPAHWFAELAARGN
ncbi:NAD-dependent epimerase/dehydratase family protein [Aeromonas enteropelogenes]|uniref:NAD-dependent epimerase/dehydratase family protein n=1 Tax=Aeromonas enteropelogenes TaxID=29489 RepID=UPI0022865018|nr:NAD-dependent epimerase/dehydratase family protein [Aeromonas enteropelogenes]MCZ0750901.1 NAD-dependent epimerase/dehydratase family protein [Aeromonas enteropelogenes]